MANFERSHDRNLAVSAWHRTAFGDTCSAFDLDLVGVCKIEGCDMDLYVIEATRADIKTTTWTERIAERLNCPGYLIQYRATDERLEAMRSFQVWPKISVGGHLGRRPIGDARETTLHLMCLRWVHEENIHGRRVSALGSLEGL